MEPTTKQTKMLQSIELKMLAEFVKVCESLGLRYYLVGGTLLGAVRHKGFIPWDDDIDVGMPREDSEIFMQKAPSLLPKNYFVQNIFSDNDYRANFAKIRNSDTTFIETSVNHCRINHGIYIDIFPLDYCYSDPKKQRKMFRKDALYKLRIAQGFNLPKAKQSLKVKVVAGILKIIYPSIALTLRKREKMMQSVPESDVYANYCGAWWKKEVVPIEWFGEGVDLEFEGIKVRAPKEYDKWLTQVYGDYMQLPPEDKRVAHHYADAIDTEKSYLEYIK